MLFARQYKYGLPHTVLHPETAKGKSVHVHESRTGLTQGRQPGLVHECRLDSTGTSLVRRHERRASLAQGHEPGLVHECRLESTGTKQVRRHERGASLAQGHEPGLVHECGLDSTGTSLVRRHERGASRPLRRQPGLVHECRLDSTGTKQVRRHERGASRPLRRQPGLVHECRLDSTGTKQVRRHERGVVRALQAAVLFGCLFLLLLCKPAAAAAAEDGRHDELLPAVGSALVEAGQGRWDAAAADVESFAALWRTANSGTPDPALAGPAAAVDAALAGAAEALAAGGGTPATTALSTLAKSVDAYLTAASGTGGGDTSAAGLEAAAKLLPAAERTRDAARSADWPAAAEAYRAVVNGWTPAERGIRADNPAVYGLLETKMSLLRVALQAEPLREEAAKAEAEALYTLLADYSAGKTVDTGDASAQPASIEGLISYLKKASAAAESGDSAGAAGIMEQFIAAWPSAEGQVQIASPKVYANIENESAAVTGDLLSDPPKLSQALATMDTMLAELTPLAGDTAYTAWDAALILLREGLEAILVLSALLSYVKREGGPKTQRWIWSGAGAGLISSIGLAVLLTYTISQAASGSARELIEGITGLVAVIMMLTIGRWLHSKSNAAAWNKYVGRQVDGALAKGSLWSLFFVAALAVLREGAETTIFYVGMAPSIATPQLLLGIGAALAVLIIVGYAIIALSAKLPIAAFFRAATVLIYYLVFRFLGESIHSLQVAGKLPAHVENGLPSVGWLGLYPTWETLLPQVLILAFILWEMLRSRSAGKSQTAG